jgi:TolB-like protein
MSNKQDNPSNSSSQDNNSNNNTNTVTVNPFSNLNTTQTNNMRTITEGFNLDINKNPK